MSEIIKCDKCKKVCKNTDTATSGSLRCSAVLPDNKDYIGSFDLCPKCAKPFWKYTLKFLNKK